MVSFSNPVHRRQKAKYRLSWRWTRLWTPVALWAGLILYVSSIPHLDSGLPYDFILRKCAHAAEYFILSYLIYRAIRYASWIRGHHQFIFVAVAAFSYAILDETHQTFVIGRHGSPWDVLIDGVGVLIFILFIYPSSCPSSRASRY